MSFKPSEHGLTEITTIEWVDGCNYEWETTTILWSPEERRFYWETSGGCSCNGPLDDVRFKGDLYSGTLYELIEYAATYQRTRDHYSGDPSSSVLDGRRVDAFSVAMRYWNGDQG